MCDDECNDAYNDDDDDNVGAVECIRVIDGDYLCDTDDDDDYYNSVTICDMILSPSIIIFTLILSYSDTTTHPLYSFSTHLLAL